MVKVQVNVQGRKEPPVDFELSLQEEILPQVETLCKMLQIREDEQHKYTLRYEKNALSDLTVAGFPTIPTNGLMMLGLKPKYEAMNVLQKLVELQSDPNLLKNTFFFLRKQLEDLEFAAAFVGQNGIMLAVNVMMDITGNALAYCLQAIEQAMNYKIGWDGIEEKHIQKIFSLIDWDESGTNKTNVVTCAIRIGVLLAEGAKHGYTTIHSALTKNSVESGEAPYSGVIACIGSTSDLNMQTDALKLVNGLYTTAPSNETKKNLLSELSGLGIQKVLQRQLNTENANWKAQLVQYQRNRMEQYNNLRLISYDKTNTEHEAILMKLWSAVFPDQELKKRVCDQWKEMGFQGQDPATDFRGMGLLGLHNLLYIAENHPVIFRRIVKEQSSRDDNDYPVAVTGISITQLLHTIFWNEKNPEDEPVHHILFDHDFAFEEMYCIIFQLLDRTWDEMNAAYMDFPHVLNAVKEKVSIVLKTSDTLASFQNGCNKGTPVEAFLKLGREAEESQVEIIIPKFDVAQQWHDEISEFVRLEVQLTIEEQKKQALKDGAVFKELNKKGKNQNPAYYQMQLAHDERELQWERIPDLTATVETFNNAVSLDDLAVVLTGQNNPLLAKLKKADEDILNNGFSLQLHDGTSFDLIAQTRDDFVNWTDGIRLLKGLKMETNETERATDVLVSSGICVRLMNLEGLHIPEDPLEVPAPPSNFNFFLRDNKEIEVQNQPRAQ